MQITSTAFSNIGGDFNHYFSSYVENEVGIFNQLYNARLVFLKYTLFHF